MADRAILYDGETARRQSVIVEPMARSIALYFDEGRRETVSLDTIVRGSDEGSAVRLERRDREGWRLIVPKPVSPALEKLLPRGTRYGGIIDRVGFLPGFLILAAIAALVLFGLYAAPATIAPIIPERWEENVGDAMVGDFGERRCQSPEADAAVAALVRRLGGDGAAARITPSILDVDFENAAALPGGNIVLFDGAIEEWDDPDALAGVIAHEIAHVEERHVTEALVRELGLGALIRIFASGAGANVQTLLDMTYTRGNEEEADREAIAMLAAAGIDMEPTAELFDRFAEREGTRRFDFLSTHPVSAERAQRFRAAAKRQGDTRPAFTDAQWEALRRACD